ncbi:mCpol domain-containing protein [Lelliottia jeotgali]
MYITIDGDDVGQRITKCYLTNDRESLFELNNKMIEATHAIADYLEKIGFSIIFCGADGVACHADSSSFSVVDIFEVITGLGEGCATFSAGTGETLRESYVALMAAKSHGKAQIYEYRSLNR